MMGSEEVSNGVYLEFGYVAIGVLGGGIGRGCG